jgi:hypothetical protein
VSQSLIHGGGWNHAAINVCADFHAYASKDAKWKNAGTAASVVIPGDVIVMTPPGDKQYGHCCIGTANGLMTCHNKAHLNIAPGAPTYPVNAIFRHQLPGSLFNETAQWAPNPTSQHETAPASCISTATATSRAIAGAKGQYEQAVCGSHSAPGYGPYRCDCSGLASYAWGYPAPGFTTSGMAGNVCTPVSWSDLRPADAILHPSEHVEIFVKWITEGSSFERAGCHNTKEGCSSGTADISYYKANGYEPCRPVSKLVCS